MHILQSWKDSLNLFKPKHFKLFALVTLKTIGETYWLLLKYFWWVLVLEIGLLMQQSNLLVPVDLLVICIWWTIVALCVRPSVAKKNYSYFGAYVLHMVSSMVAFILALGFLMLVPALLASLLRGINYFHLLKVLAAVIVPGVMILYFFFMFFLIDMPFGLKNWGRSWLFACKMLWYNLPFGVLNGGFIVGFWLIRRLVAPVSQYIAIEDRFIAVLVNADFFFFLFLPIVISIIGNFYIKRLHEQPQLYFKQPKE